MKKQIPGKWDRRFLKLAKEVSTWSKDPRKQIGAIIVGEKNQVVSQGYNAFPRGVEDTNERYGNKEVKLKFVVHAEANAIYNAIHNGANTNGASIYVTGLCVCHECAKAIIQTGITEVVMDSEPEGKWEESGKLSLEMFREAGVTCKILDMRY